ncbi:hypothetical protein ACHWQZ_G013859 [Mnemiopsis leidyi]
MNVLDTFEEDDTYKCFLSTEYDAEKYANSIIASSTVSQTLQALQTGVEKLNFALEEHVSDHYEDLINQATGMDILEESLAIVKTRIDQLQRSMTTIKKRLSEPYNQMTVRTQQLGRLQKTCDVLRRVTRIQYLTKRLKQQLDGGIKEITKTSQTFNELQYLYGDGDLEGIEVIDKDIDWVKKARADMEVQAEQLLTQGLSSFNQNQTSTALQVFNSIGTLQLVVSKTLQSKCGSVEQNLKSALSGSYEQSYNGAAPGGANIGNTTAWRASLWTSLDKWSNNISSQYNQIHVLHRTLVRRRDASSQKTLLEECNVTPIQTYVSAVSSALQQELRNVNSSAKQALNMEYPKALRLVVSLWNHFSAKLDVEGLEDVTLPNINIREVLTPFQCTYLARSLNRLLDPVNIAFPGKTVPSTSEMESIVRIMVSELTAARGDEELKKLSTNNILKAIRDILNKCESLTHHGSGINDITSAPTQYHIRNIQVINVLCTLHSKLEEVPADLSAGKTEVWNMISDSVNSLLDPFRSQIEHILNTIHDTDFGFDKQDITDCSTYINLIEETINHLVSNYLSHVSNKTTVLPKLQDFQDSLISLYLHHLCAVRPLGEGGKMMIATDIAEMERVLGGLLDEHAVSEQFKVLRAFRAVLFLSVEDLCTVRNVPKPMLLNHMFSRAGDALLSPYKVAGWTPSQYVAWLYSHPYEVVDMIQGTIQWYEDMIRESGAPAFDPIYPHIIKLLQN